MRPRTPVTKILLPLLFGFILLNQTLTRPRLSDIHNVDTFSLVVAGICFGVALNAVAGFVRSKMAARNAA